MSPRNWILLAIVFGTIAAPSVLFARGGGGGGFHGGGGFGGGGFHGGYGGGGFRGGDFGGGRDGGYGGFDRAGGYGAGVDRGAYGGYGAGRYDGYGRAAGDNAVRPETLNPARSNLGFNDHRALPGDWGMSHPAPRGYDYLDRGNFTRPVSAGWGANRATDVRRNFNQFNYYDRGWYGAHPGAWHAAGWRHGYYWGWANWAGLGAWFGWGAGISPIYYDYGNAIVYQGDEVYSGGQPIASADEYYQQAADLAQSGANDAADPPTDSTGAPPSGDDWTPLGVFSLVQGEQSDTSALFQLAVDKQGEIAGNYSDVLSGSTLPVHGAVDQKNQRAAWTVGNNSTTVYETGIYNLTKDQTPLLVHFGKDRTQQWLLVRMKQPASAADNTDATAPTDGNSDGN